MRHERREQTSLSKYPRPTWWAEEKKTNRFWSRNQVQTVHFSRIHSYYLLLYEIFPCRKYCTFFRAIFFFLTLALSKKKCCKRRFKKTPSKIRASRFKRFPSPSGAAKRKFNKIPSKISLFGSGSNNDLLSLNGCHKAYVLDPWMGSCPRFCLSASFDLCRLRPDRNSSGWSWGRGKMP